MTPLRELNAALHAPDAEPAAGASLNPRGAHALAVGIDAPSRSRSRATSATTAPA